MIGKKWVKMNNNIPSVPVLDLAVHPRGHDLIVAALGRNVFVTHISALQELNQVERPLSGWQERMPHCRLAVECQA
jgi:hypothetical protein